MTDLEAFGERLSQERRRKAFHEKRDILKKDVAKAIGTSESSLGRWEAGLVWPDESSLDKLAAYYHVTKAWLRYGVESTPADPPLPGRRKIGEDIPDPRPRATESTKPARKRPA